MTPTLRSKAALEKGMTAKEAYDFMRQLKTELYAMTAERDAALLALGRIQSTIREVFELDRTPVTPDEVREVLKAEIAKMMDLPSYWIAS